MVRICILCSITDPLSPPPQFAFDILSCHKRRLRKLSICHIIPEPLKLFFFGCHVSLLPRKLRCRSPQFAILGCPSQFRKVRDMAERQDQDWYPENKKLLIKIGIREIRNFSTLLMHLRHASISIRRTPGTLLHGNCHFCPFLTCKFIIFCSKPFATKCCDFNKIIK